MRNVLVIAYYFPPMGLSGVQRVAKFVKYLPEYGWRPVVLTVEPGGYFAYDDSLLAELERAGVEIHRTYSYDPTRLFGRGKTVRMPSEPSRRWFSFLSQSVFIPDNKLGWYYPAVRRGRSILGEKEFHVVFSSAPPYTGHLIGKRLSSNTGLPLVVDFRDDWVGNPRHEYPLPAHRKLHESLERRVLRGASAVITINERIAASLRSRQRPDAESDVAVIPQGYDPQDFETHPIRRSSRRLQFLHCGIFYDRQTPDVFLEGLAHFLRKRPDAVEAVEATFVGMLPESSRMRAARLGLEKIVNVTGYVPHERVPSYLLAADVLWMTIGDGPGAESISTGKLFEYMGARKPILALIPPGAANDVLTSYSGARIVPPGDPYAVADALERCYDDWARRALRIVDEAEVRRFNRRELAGELARIFDRVAAHSYSTAP